MERLVLVHGSVTGGDRPGARNGGASQTGSSSSSSSDRASPAAHPRPRRLRGAGRMARELVRPATTSSVTRTAASSRSSPQPSAGARALADGDRATRARGWPSTSRRSLRSREGGAELWENGPRHDPEAFLRALPRGRRIGLRPTVAAAAGARAGRPRARRGARPVGGGDPARRAGGRAVPEARRLGRPPPGVRRDLRRARARPRAERLVLPGYGHNAQLHPDFNAAVDGLRRARSTPMRPRS